VIEGNSEIVKKISLEDLSKNFGCSLQNFSMEFINFYNTLDMRYQYLEKQDRDAIILQILHKLENDQQVIASPERTIVWEQGWKENLDSFKRDKTAESILPKFVRGNKVVRYNGDFIKPLNPNFERDFIKLIQIFCYNSFVQKFEIKNVYEFGCGSSLNLLSFAELNQNYEEEKINFYGSDFVQSSVELCNELGTFYNYNLKGFLFDMITPDYNLFLEESSAVFTFGAIEQLGGKFYDFIDMLLDKKPKVCFHIEPTIENYKPDNLFDHLQIKFHNKRGYTKGLLPYLQKLEKEEKIKIFKNKRLNFGSLFMEGYHLYAWEIL